ncbi:MAG: hypothetical protein Q9220_002754 [cf. Caloplaca sp. 1 TL-2023]
MLSEEKYKSFHRLLEDIQQSPSSRVFYFRSLKDLHIFQAYATGSTVLFDGYSKTFTISRGRSVVAIHKRWEAFTARLQIVKNGKTTQLLAFFADFSHGSCMSFVLRSTDVFESFTRSGSFYLCIVDAKFALPKTESGFTSQSLCLDQPDLPAEHDDITIGFDTEEAQDVAPPLHVSTTFRYADDPEELIPAADTDISSTEAHIYSRHTAPNTTRLEAILTSIIHAPCLTYSSGLAALHAIYVGLNPRRVSIGDGYHGSHGVLAIQRKLCGTTLLPLDCPASDLEAGDVIHLETPLNPTGEAYDIRSLAEKAHGRRAILLVDATFGPPGLQDPFKWGADVVMHSGTKYLGGHSDMLCGVLATNNKDILTVLKDERVFLGSVMGSMEGWLGVRSLRTLELRVKKQSENATRIVQWLDNCKRADGKERDAEVVQAVVHEVQHASLQHAEMAWLKQQMPSGFGPVFAIWFREERMARRLPSLLTLFHHATSLGGVESLIEWRSMSDRTVDRRLVRVSIGIEDWEDLKADLMQGFQKLLKG